jgi:hypothetical protein
LVLCSAALSGCASIPVPGTKDKALERKAVVRKQEPNELVASDQSRCLTTAAKMVRTQIGQQVWCVWHFEVRPNPSGREG